MPKKRLHRKRGYGKRKRGKKSKLLYGTNQSMPKTLLNYVNNKTLLPSRLKTTCTASITGYYPVGAGHSAVDLLVNMNFPQNPFNQTISGRGSFNNFIVVGGSASSTTLTPFAYNTLVGADQFYSSVRVYGCSVKIGCLPQNTADDTYMAMAPVTLTPPTTYNDYQKMCEAPLSIGPKPVQYYQEVDKAYLKKYWNTAETAGVSRETVLTNPNYVSLLGSIPAASCYIQCSFWNMSGTNYAGILSVSMKVKYYLELFNSNENNVPIV